ncbi:MAG: M23 family metallopeptidase, partial [Saprospiraceae bacterium]|nr:M23 family metallopeptidase [Saprospiraceae bacterium]
PFDPNSIGVTDSTGIIISGCPDTEYDDWFNSPYVLPYPVGYSYPVDLSHCSGSYHSAGQPDQFAIDFRMSIDELVTAARAGKVIHIEESGVDGGFPNNLVIVEHADGTFGQYMHLTNNGALVEVGDTVKIGDDIGRSGATGLAGYPHLHFVVTQSGDYRYPYQSIPTTFRNTEANERSLLSGHTYKAEPY